MALSLGQLLEQMLVDPKSVSVWRTLSRKVRSEGRLRFEYPDAGGRMERTLLRIMDPVGAAPDLA